MEGILDTINQLSYLLFHVFWSHITIRACVIRLWKPVKIKVDNMFTAPWPIKETELPYIHRTVNKTINHLTTVTVIIVEPGTLRKYNSFVTGEES